MQYTIVLPDLGQTTNEARILKWLKCVGEPVTRGEPLLAVETDKVDMEVESFENGFLREVLVPEGEKATALAPIAILTEGADEPYQRPGDHPAEPPAKRRVAAVPGARERARELGIDLEAVKGTGARGMITREDVEQFTRAANGSENRAWAAMAATVVASKREIPHFYAARDLDLNHATGWRKRQNENGSDHISLNDVFVRCAKLALADSPRLRTAFDSGRYRPHERAGVLVIAARGDALILEPTESSEKASATLAISNLGMYGVKQFAAIIPPGCTAVLAIGAARQEPVVREGKVVIAEICTTTLSADHRVVDGIAAARFLERLQHHLNSL
jgi:pyruvate dehydrogenase E2 component (dihydrolipoamide acetyltransferase)